MEAPVSTLDYKDTPLKQILDDLQVTTGVNIVPDEPALNEAGISLDKPVTMKLEGVALKSALNLLLHQVHLTYVIGDEVLKVTTEDQARGRMEVKTYQVLDLIMAVPDANANNANPILKAAGQLPADNPNLMLNQSTPYLGLNSMAGPSTPMSQSQLVLHNGAAASSSSATPTVTKQNPKGTLQEELIRLIMNTIAPQTWRDMGGQGTIDYYPLGMALVINQTPDIQEQVADLLAALRRLQDQQVAVEMRFITIAENFFERIGVDFNINIRNNQSQYETSDRLAAIQAVRLHQRLYAAELRLRSDAGGQLHPGPEHPRSTPPASTWRSRRSAATRTSRAATAVSAWAWPS